MARGSIPAKGSSSSMKLGLPARARAIFENWHYWVLVNAASFALYLSQGLALVSVLYVVYFTIALIGLRRWSRDAKIDTAEPDG